MKNEGPPQDQFEVFGPIGADAGLRPCAAPGCPAEGSYRAPKSRDQLREYRWFCLDHVRIYNASWNYYVGLSDSEMEAHIRSDLVGNRPTWPLGKGQQAAPAGPGGATPFDNLADPFGLLRGHGPQVRGAPPPPALTPAEKRAFSTLGLDYGVSYDELRAQYKALVKRHHPDTHNGSKEAEERLKRINEAYKTLKTRLFA